MSAAAPQAEAGLPAGPKSARQTEGRIGIVAGSGTLPIAVAEAAAKAGHNPFILGLEGDASAAIERFAHAYANIGQIGRMLSVLRTEGCTQLVFLGGIKRPNVFRVKIDTGFFWYLPKLLRVLKGGDDTVLRGVARFFEDRGFSVLAAHEVAPELLAPEGSFSHLLPSARDLEDIELGFAAAHALGLFDIGQAAVVSRGSILAVEAAEGTDAMLSRCGPLNRWGYASRSGVLVKRPKAGQDRRLDLPAIGPRTVELAAAACLAGIAVEAGAVLLADAGELVEKANKAGVFLYGISPEKAAAKKLTL